MYKLVTSKSPENLGLPKKLRNNSRYIDDILICDKDNINDFIQCFKDIYLTSIPLTSGTAENDRDTFFYSDVNIGDGNFVTIIYHKVDHFNFS